MGRCLTDLDRHGEAEESLSSAYRGLEPLRDQHARLWGSVLTELARLHRDLDQPDEATRYESMHPDVGS